MIESIQVQKRDVQGSWAVAKLRGSGYVPAILYGHGEANIMLSVKNEAVASLIRHGSKLVSLTGDVTDTALLREVQWDSMGSYITHLDFARVSQTETVEVTLPIHLYGEAPGAQGVGQLRFVTHDITISCPALAIPEFLTVDISSLELGKSIHISEMKLPEGATTVTPPETVIVQVIVPNEKDEEAATAVEPELIRKEKAADADAKA